MYDVECLTWKWFWLGKYLLHARRRLGDDYVKIVLYFCDSEDLKIMLFPKPVGRRTRTSSPFSETAHSLPLLRLQNNVSIFQFQKNLTLARFLLGLRHYFVSLVCLFSTCLQNVNRPIRMPRNQNLRLTGDEFSGGRFFFFSPCPPLLRFVTRPRPIS